MKIIQSTNLVAVGYDHARSVLTVQFKSGGTYEYAGAPSSLYDALFAAQPHPWTAHGRTVKQYPYTKI